MSAVVEVREPGARYLQAVQPAVVREFELLVTAPGGVGRLREFIMSLALQGSLLRQDSRDEPASTLLKRIAEERTRLMATGSLRQSRVSTAEDASEPLSSLPQGWAWSKLAAIGVINPRNHAADDVVASFVQMSSIPVAFNEPHIAETRPWHDIKSGFTQFAEGDVGVAKITPCFENGKSTVFQNLSNGIGAGTTELHIVRPLCGVVPRYVLLFLKSPGFLREGEATMTGTAGQKRLPRSFFEDCPFPLPPLAEQTRIVARVDALMGLCDALEAKVRLEAEQHAHLLGTLLGTLTDSSTPEELAANWQRVADHFDLLLDRPEAVAALEQLILQLAVRGLLVPQVSGDQPASLLLEQIRANGVQKKAQGRKVEAVAPAVQLNEVPFEVPESWAWSRFGQVAEIASNLVSPGAYGSEWQVAPDCIEKGTGRLLVKRTVAEADIKSANHRFQPGQIIYSKIRPSLSKAVIVDFAGLCSADMYPINSKISTQYLLLVILSRCFLDQVAAAENRVKMPKLNQEALTAFLVPVPPLAEQERIVARVADLRRLCTDLRQSLSRSSSTQSALAEALIEYAQAP